MIFIIISIIAISFAFQSCQTGEMTPYEWHEQSYITIDSIQIDNLLKVCRVWGNVKYGESSYSPTVNLDNELLNLIESAMQNKDVSLALDNWKRQILSSSKKIFYKRTSPNQRYYRTNRNTKVACHDQEWPYDEEAVINSAQLRLLSLFRYWNVIEYFSPHRPDNWYEVLKEMIPKFAFAQTWEAYINSIECLSHELHDNHAIVRKREQRSLRYIPLNVSIIKGIVANVSSVPEKTSDGSISYTVIVDFPDGLESTYHEEFPLIQQMDGIAEIITVDRRVIDYFINPIASLFRNR